MERQQLRSAASHDKPPSGGFDAISWQRLLKTWGIKTVTGEQIEEQIGKLKWYSL